MMQQLLYLDFEVALETEAAEVLAEQCLVEHPQVLDNHPGCRGGEGGHQYVQSMENLNDSMNLHFD